MDSKFSQMKTQKHCKHSINSEYKSSVDTNLHHTLLSFFSVHTISDSNVVNPNYTFLCDVHFAESIFFYRCLVSSAP